MAAKDRYTLEEQMEMRAQMNQQQEKTLREQLQNLEVGDIITSETGTIRTVESIDNKYIYFLIKRVGKEPDYIKSNKADFMAMPLDPIVSIIKASDK